MDILAFNAVIHNLVMTNPLGCVSYMSAGRYHPPVERVREQYTAKFVYLDTKGKRIGSSSEVYDSVEGYETGIAAVISNMANIASHRGRVRHMRQADLFSVLLKCRDENGELYFISLARDRVTVSSYEDDPIRRKLEGWTDSVAELA